MHTISAIIIAKNNQETLPTCLSSVAFCNEIIIIDGGSSDETVSIAKKFGAHVITKVTNNFAEQRNIGLENAKGDWILYIDTDELVSKELRINIEKVIKSGNEIHAYALIRKNYYFGNNVWPKSEKLERLFRKDSIEKWVGELHESPLFHGTLGVLPGFLLHSSHRDLSSMVIKTNQWSEIEAKLRYNNKHPQMIWWRFFRVMITGFSNSYFGQDGWKAGTIGILESCYQAFSMFITYAKLWELQRKS